MVTTINHTYRKIKKKKFLIKRGNKMFGYIKPYNPELKVKELETYKSIYCSVCKSLGKKFGTTAKFLLSYDATFLAMLLLAFESEPFHVCKKRCTINPLKKCKYIESQEKIFRYSSTITILLSYNKFIDDVHDSRGFKKFIAKILSCIYKRRYKKIKNNSPELVTEIEKQMSEQNNIEQNTVSIDAYAHPSASILSHILSFPFKSKKPDTYRILQELGYHLGRWVYFIDAADDMEKDKKNKNFNPFLKTNTSPDEIKKILNQTIARTLAAFDLLKLNSLQPILENTILQGLTHIQNQILNKTGGYRNERSI